MIETNSPGSTSIVDAAQRRNVDLARAVHLPQIFGLEYRLQQRSCCKRSGEWRLDFIRVWRGFLASGTRRPIRTPALRLDPCGWPARPDRSRRASRRRMAMIPARRIQPGVIRIGERRKNLMKIRPRIRKAESDSDNNARRRKAALSRSGSPARYMPSTRPAPSARRFRACARSSVVYIERKITRNPMATAIPIITLMNAPSPADSTTSSAK